jgi:integrase/recombinase XerD
MSSTLATPASIAGAPQEEIVALGFLARYRNPTRDGYAMSIRQWFQFCYDHQVEPMKAQRADIEMWIRKLDEIDGLKNSTMAGKLNAVCGMYRFAVRDGYLPASPAEYVRRPTVPRYSTTQGMTRSELLRVLDLAKASGPRDHALACILGLNGLRIGEVCSLNVQDVGRSGGYHTVKFVREKSNRQEAEIPLSPRTSHAVEQCMWGRTNGPLFLMRGLNGAEPQRIDRRAADRVVKRLVKAAGITKRITPHSFRHTFVTLSLDAGVSVRDVQNSCGHADPRMVAFYDRNKDSLPRHATHFVSAFVEGS